MSMIDVISAMNARLVSQLSDITPAVVVVNGPVEISKWPAIARYMIELIPGQTYQEQQGDHYNVYCLLYPVTIVVRVRRWDENKSLYGTASNEIGVIRLCERVRLALINVDLEPVWKGLYPGGEAQTYKPLNEDEAARWLGDMDGYLRSRFWRIGIVDYLGQAGPESMREGA